MAIETKIFRAPRKKMERIKLIGLLSFVGAVSCMDRKPAPVCPVPTKVNYDENLPSEFDGVDLLVVVDNSASMEEEQQILATGFFTLINSLVKPITGTKWPYPAVDNMRVAIVSSDMGLQYGPQRSIDGFPYGRDEITERPRGDDGVFQTQTNGIVNVESGQIKCGGDGKQCPVGWTCSNGTCNSPSGGKEAVNCPQLNSGNTWAETSLGSPNADLATQVACMAELGKDGCGIEQQLESSIRALSRNDAQKAFMHEDHLLAVLVVSDEEDCSIEDKGLFATKEWHSKNYDENDPGSGLLNTACNLPSSNEDFLFDPSRYYTELVKLKNNQSRGVVFAAIVGVPTGEDAGGNSPCEGQGDLLGDCLKQDSMALKIGLIKDEKNGDFKHFQPACERRRGNTAVTSARPGRRYVQVAESFGSNGYVYSICNQDWSPAMKDIAQVIAQNVTRQCYTDRLEWTMLDENNTRDAKLLGKHKDVCSGGKCGVAKCEIVVTFEYPIEADLGCPAEFGLTDGDMAQIVRETLKDSDGNPVRVKVHCPLPKLPSPIDCTKAFEEYGDSAETGWFYCENARENYEETCSDKFDNDGDGSTDCSDDECADCIACNGTGVTCQDSCRYGVELTQEAKKFARGKLIAVQCIQEFSFEDTNCRENTPESCNDGEDNDGNGQFDCIDTISNPEHESVELDGYHFADPNCCPMDVENGKCKVHEKALANCGGDSPSEIDACIAAATINRCSF